MLTPGMRYSAEQVLPQSEGMRLLDSIDGYGEDWIEARAKIRTECLVADPVHGVPGWFGLEYMAQAVAAYAGIQRVQAGERPSIGVLLGTREYRCELDHFPFGMVLRVRAEVVMRDEQGFAACNCSIHDGDVVVARAALKGYQPRDIHELLRKDRHE